MATVRTSAEDTSFTLTRPILRMWHQTRSTWAAVTAWRDRRQAIGQVQSMSDAQLKDIGISRAEIEALARGDIDITRRRRGWGR